jgi:lipid II isoglutaminyl synthase (glutamine-hydrolysing)
MQLRIGYLYPDLLNIYGDRGNIICLRKRCQWRGIKTTITKISLNYRLKAGEFDLFFGGGGQDQQQLLVSKDLQSKKKVLKKEAEAGTPMLTICGTYQLFGHFFKTQTDKKIAGISIFNIITIASNKRKVGNIVLKTKLVKPKLIVGFENHSGSTFLKEKSKTKPLGKVLVGFGNNAKDKKEGAIFKNTIGCYLHGPVLPKNPHLADFLIKKALEKKYNKKIGLKKLNDKLEWQTHKTAVKRAYKIG